MRIVTAIGLLVLFTLSATAQSTSYSRVLNEPLPIEVANSARLFAPSAIDISPDGSWVAYTLSDPRRRKVQGRRSDLLSVFACTGAPYAFADNDVLITNTKTGQTINVSAGEGANWNPSWSPDGKFLAFYSDRSGKAHIWLWQRSTARLRPLATAIVHVRFRFEKILWTPDSGKVITKVLGIGQKLDGCFSEHASAALSAPSPIVVYEEEPTIRQLPSSTSSFLADLAMLDVASGKVNRIIGQEKIVGYSLSPKGDQIVFSSPKQVKPNDQYLWLYDLMVVSLSDGLAKTVHHYSPGTPSLPVSWSPDGRLLAYISEGECFIWPITREPQKVRSSPQSGFSQSPLWDPQGRSIYLVAENKIWRSPVTDPQAVAITEHWDRQIRAIMSESEEQRMLSLDNGRSIIVSTNDPHTKQEGFYKVDLRSGNFKKIIESDAGYNITLSAVSDQGDVLYAVQTAQQEQNLWIAKRDFSSPRQLTRINLDLERYAAGDARLIDYSDGDGKKLNASLLLPANYQTGKRYPLIVWVYGGSMLSTGVNHYGSAPGEHDNMQLFSTRGYAVLLPDSPLRVGSPVKDLATAVLPAIDKAVAIGVADPDRVGIMGLSYGGYSTLALITQTARFKAAVMGVGFGNLINSYGVMLKNGMPFGVGWAEEGQGRMGGPPWEYPERYVQNSPVFYLDKIQTPLLITQGGMDISPFQSDEVFVGLRRLGKKVIYVRYENEGHGIEDYNNRVDYWNRVINWFGSHLQTNLPLSAR